MDVDHQEEEVKLTLLSEEGLERLIGHLGIPERTIEQSNEYFDTVGQHLLAERVMLRIRRQGKDLIVTTKSNAQILVGGLRCREIEHKTTIEESISHVEAGLHTWDIAPVRHALGFVPSGSIFSSLGQSTNVRRFYAYENDGVLEVDRTVLPDGTIHAELELETTQMAERLSELRYMLEKLEVAYTDSVIPKYQRFLSARASSS